MARKHPGQGLAHINPRTAGTSNELSFSVLEAKSHDADAATATPRTVTELGKVSVFTLPGKQQMPESQGAPAGFSGFSPSQKHTGSIASGATTLGPQSEVSARKQRRRSRQALNVAAVLAIVGIFVFLGATTIGTMAQRQRGGEVAIASALSLLEQSDAAIVALDNAVDAPASSDAASVNAIIEDVSAASSLLDRAANSAEAATTLDAEDAIKESASVIKESVAARKQLIEQGRLILTESVAAKKATTFLERAWESIIAADALARDAATLAEQGTSASIEGANEASTKALAGFQEALVLVRQAKTAYPKADYALLEEYVVMRSNAQQNALVGNAAQLSQDMKTLEANSAAYNEAEALAAEIAAQLPSNPAQPVVDAFATHGGAAHDAYQQARQRAAQADASVRQVKENQG